ncbi:MAG TPA: GGDEF domain-containing protein [Polyangiaceae bacterium]|nr:GGDEF domain-containing protein [Polyangiaceae bacterium]
MFWKRNDPTPPGPPSASGRAQTQPEAEETGRGGLESRDLDASIDAVVGLLKAFGEHAFDTDNVSAEDTRAECDGWARKISMGEQVAGAGPLRRDFGGARRYFNAHRAHEREYVSSSVTNLREAVHAFARCLTRTVGEDRSADARVGAQLGHLVAAFSANDADVIRREAEGVVQVVTDVMEQRKKLQQEQLQVLSEKIQKLKAELHEARESAALDPLTQLHNRSSLDSQLERVADLSFLMSATPCLLMIDVDHFKSVNDRFGHPIGDEVIRRVADTLVRNFLRREDFVARYGGEEFVVVVPDSSAHAVRQRAERVRQAIGEIGFSKGKEHFSVTASIGVAVLGPGDTGKTWLSRADAALYEAKSAGRNRVVFAEDTGGAAPSLRPSRPPSQAPTRTISSGSLRLPAKSG